MPTALIVVLTLLVVVLGTAAFRRVGARRLASAAAVYGEIRCTNRGCGPLSVNHLRRPCAAGGAHHLVSNYGAKPKPKP